MLSGSEAKAIGLAQAIRRLNPQAPLLYYYTVDQARTYSGLGAWFEAHPELLVHAADGSLLEAGGWHVMDWGKQAAIEAWATAIGKTVRAGGFSGVFIDGYHSDYAKGYNHKSPTITGRHGSVNSTDGKAWVSGIFNGTGRALEAALPSGSLRIPNCEGGELCQDGEGGSGIPGYNGIMMEYFGVKTIEELQAVAAANTTAETNGYIKGYSGHSFLLPKLAAFLVGMGENSYFGSSGLYWTCAGDEAVVPELVRPLGPPLGLGTARNATFVPPGKSSKPTQVTSWQRSFGKGTKVELNISQVAKFDLHHDVWCCIWWSDGATSTCPNSKCGQ